MKFIFWLNNLSAKTMLFILLFISLESNAQKKTRPNIIFILADDVGYDLLSVNGNKSYATPNIDSMAHHGINFTHCEGMPLCSPSRHMLLTGKYNFRNYSNTNYMLDSETTFGNLMHNAGYKTAFFGKLQFPFSPSSMRNWGFDIYTVFDLTEDTSSSSRYKSPKLVDNNGQVADSVVANKYCDDILTDRILSFINNKPNKPFFIYYPMSLAHPPFSPTPNDTAYANWSADSPKSDTTYLHSMMSYMDMEVGKIMSKLKETSADTNTIVIFAGDNGTPTEIHYTTSSNENIRGQKGLTLEGGTHVPLIVYWANHIQHRFNDDLIDFTDFFPTLAEAAHTKDLSKFGVIDGLSFYSRILGIEDTAKSQLFFHYDAHPGFDTLKRWVRSKTYKLYDSSITHKVNFYNIVNDESEQYSLPDSMLTDKEKNIKLRFQHILDTMPNWGDAPDINKPYFQNITASSVVVGATIVNSGSSKLIDRGSTFTKAGTYLLPTLDQYRMHDSIVSLGKFSEKLTNLKSQTKYYFSLYAMNASLSHSTGFAEDSFYTFSNPPLTQPDFFKSSINNCSVLLHWNKAIFPSDGAIKAGYAVFYSTDSVQLINNPNGHNPSEIIKNGNVVILIRQLPNLPDTFVHISQLAKNIKYYFLLVPYTCNGRNDSTYNYLIKNALSKTINPIHSSLSLNSTIQNPLCYGENNGSITWMGVNGIPPYKYGIDSTAFTSDSVYNNLAGGFYLIKVKDAGSCLDSELINLLSPEKLKLSLSVTNATCVKRGEIIALAKKGIPPYRFSIDNGPFDTISVFKNLPAGNYKISLKDSNKCLKSTDAKVLQAGNCLSGLKILPNPSKSFFTVLNDNKNLFSPVIIKVYDVSGKLIFADQFVNKDWYSFGKTLSTGIYFVKFQSGSDIISFKIFKK